MFLRTAWLVLRKDFAIEVKSLEVLTTTLFFAISCVLISAIAIVKNGQAPEDAAAGILWIAIAFSGTLALGRASATAKRCARCCSRRHRGRRSTSANCSAC